MNTVFPVIIKIPEKKRTLKGKDLVASLSRFARKALAISAEKSGQQLNEDLVKDDTGAPQPVNGIYWSLSHKPDYAAGVVSTQCTGIDVEKIKPFKEAIKRKIAGQIEWDLGGAAPPHHLFFRYWTAKETVLKATGQGLKGLSSCTIIEIPDEHNMKLACRNREYTVEHMYFDGHIASVIKNENDIVWSILEGPDFD
jgi:4'-phosphopantetheinyl transferase